VSAQAQIGFLIGMVVTFALSVWMFFSAHKMREQAEQQRRRMSEDVRHIVEHNEHMADMARMSERMETRSDMRQAVKDVVTSLDLSIGYEAQCIAIPHQLLLDAHFESRDFGDEWITVQFRSTGAQWEDLKRHLEELNGGSQAKEKVQPKARNGKGA
jgi:hypothetical protein